ncbi:MAG: ATP-binding cassette domain-containing protein [Candidatus Eisenbacteria bacterium]
MEERNDKVPNIVEVEDLRVGFDDTPVLRDLSLGVRKGEVLGLVGESGCGKTTLLRTILLLHEPAGGRILLFGEDTGKMRSAGIHRIRRRMGVLFQYGALFSSLTVLENVGVPFKEHTNLSHGAIREIGMVKIALAGLPESAAAKYPSELSGGMRKRAALARAIALDPELLLLDEPTAGLDPIGAAAFDDLVLQLAHDLGLTLLMVTHDLDTLWRVTDRIAVLGEGRILAIGPKEVVAVAGHPWIREYFQGPRGRAATRGALPR